MKGSFAVLGCLVTLGCAEDAASRVPTTPPAVATAPDLHGEPLGWLPGGAVAWARLDMAALRQSSHFDGALDLARGLGADLDTLERELGFDAFRQAEALAVAIYLPPGRDGDQGWPVVYARGHVARDEILAAARARLPGGTEPTEAVESGIAYTALGARAYIFPAPDVVLVMERSLVRRVTARLAGTESASVLGDNRFATLWEDAGGSTGGILLATDLAALRARSSRSTQGGPPEANALEAFVARADLSPGITLHAAGRARDAAGAQSVVQALDAVRHTYAGQLGVRLLRLSHLLEDGIATSATGRFVVVSATATDDETSRLLRAVTLLHDVTAGPAER